MLMNLQLLIDSTPALIHSGLPDGYLDFFNQRWLNYVGLSLENLSGWKWTATIHPEDVGAFVEKWRAAFATGEPFEQEARVRRADGEYRWMVHRIVPLHDGQGNIVRWCGSSIDVEDRKRAENDLWRSEALFAEAQRLTRVGSWIVKLPDILEYWSPVSFDIFGIDPATGPPRNIMEFMSHVHPDDREGLLRATKEGVAEGHVFDYTFRIVRPNGEIRVIREVGTPVHENTVLTRYIGAWMDMTEQVQRIEELRQSQLYLAEGKRLAHMGNWAFNPSGFYDHWSPELFEIYGLDPAMGAPTLEEYLGTVHPQDREFMARTVERMLAEGLGCDVKKRIVRPDGELRYIRYVGVPIVDNGIVKSIVGTAVDVTEQEHLTQQLQRRQAYLADVQRLSRTGSFVWRVSTGEIIWSEESFRIFEYDQSITLDQVLQRAHPEDVALVKQTIERALQHAKDFDFEHRLLMSDGSVKYVHVVAHALSDESGSIEFVGAVMDVTAAKQAEERIRQDERELRLIVETIPAFVWAALPDGSFYLVTQSLLDYTGLSREELMGWGWMTITHHDDLDRVVEKWRAALAAGEPIDQELRIRHGNGKYRWFLVRAVPLRDDKENIVKWYGTLHDIDDQKRAEDSLQKALEENKKLSDQLYKENIALREEIDKTSMFEEIVGASPPLKAVLARIIKVAPTDSTVFITGETGTGKELVARAIHKRSKRSSRAFVSVNCAAIPAPLIASDLFGHEKGAFTGAHQRRLGRFELAEGGTIFLDEIGELPTEAQIALLRVLQEHEFERVGGNQAIRTNVRVIAATNRDLKAAIEAGSFRSDLSYRLNVFPIEIPPLRERKEDIPMLVQYFIDRYASKAGKKIRGINKKTLDLFQSYPWPGNIRELQNVIERSVIVCDTENFSVDESWLVRESRQTEPVSQPLSDNLVTHEKAMIEAALVESRGRVSGPMGAAAKLGIPPSTLESKIRSLKINKHRFKPA
jgi:PAS domain S-box-containing protein